MPKISQMTPTSKPVSGSELVPLVQNGYNVQGSLYDIGCVQGWRPESFGAIGDGQSHPLSTVYTNLADAQAVYPNATALTDEIDWCAWQKMADYMWTYTKANNWTNSTGGNFAHAKVYASGRYVINKTVTFHLADMIITGTIAPVSAAHITDTRGTDFSCFIYNGPNGTVDNPTYLLDFYIKNELNVLPTGFTPGNGIGVRVLIERMGFIGKNGTLSGSTTPDDSGYISGIRFRFASFCRVTYCMFGGTLYDGIVYTDAQLFPEVDHCFFYGVYRDAISNMAKSGNFSTTQWIHHNEFGLVGRYAILLDLFGSVEAMPSITTNSFEHAFAGSYYAKNPQFWVHGVVAGMCFIGCGNLVFADNRTEAITLTTGYLGDVHLVQCTNPTFRDNVFHNLILTTNKSSQPRTTAMINFLSTNGWSDITDTRSYQLGSSSDHGSPTENLSIINDYNLNYIWVADSQGLGTSGIHTFIGAQFQLQSMAITAGNLVDTVTAKTPMDITGLHVFQAGAVLTTTSIKNTTTIAQPLQYQTIFTKNPAMQTRRCSIDNQTEILLHNLPLRQNQVGTKWNGYTGWMFNNSLGDMSANEVNYVDLPMFHASPVDETGVAWQAGYYEAAVVTKRKIRYEFNAAPSSGTWRTNDIVYANNVVPGGMMGWVCTAGGTPGTWQQFGKVTGGGAQVTQATSKTTGVTLNNVRGEITMNAAALAANTRAQFTLTNSKIGANDTIIVHRKSGGTAGSYIVGVDSVAAGSAVIYLKNDTAGSLSEAVVLQFEVMAGAIS